MASPFRLVRAWFCRIMPPRRAKVLGVVAVAVFLFVATRDGVFGRVRAAWAALTDPPDCDDTRATDRKEFFARRVPSW